MMTDDVPEPILERLVHLLMPLAVPDHLLLLGKVLPLAHRHRAVEVLSIKTSTHIRQKDRQIEGEREKRDKIMPSHSFRCRGRKCVEGVGGAAPPQCIYSENLPQ